MSDAFSVAGSRVHNPFGPRKSGMPLSVEIPAPVSTITALAVSISDAAAATWIAVTGMLMPALYRATGPSLDCLT